MQPHEERIVEERRELSERIVKLAKFISASEIFNTLHKIDQDLLKEQRDAMISYHDALDARIERLTADRPEKQP